MTQEINNREYRQKVLKDLIMQLHDGKSLEEVKPIFEKNFKNVSASEISELEQNLIMEGMPVEEIQRLCDVHSAVFKGSIEQIHQKESMETQTGHPVHIFKQENKAVEELIEQSIKPHLEAFKVDDNQENRHSLLQDFNLLWDIDKHYKRKENLIFPYLEKYGISGPTKVMWGVDDEIRESIKDVKQRLLNYQGEKESLIDKIDQTLGRVSEMVFKENNILLPMAEDNLTEDEWIVVAEESDELGYCLVEPEEKWIPERVDVEKKDEVYQSGDVVDGLVKFETGVLTLTELSCILNTLPFDIAFIDKDDIVKYYSQGKERIFPRTKAVIGRTVQNCHPPGSVEIVNKILDDFKTGNKDNEDFWIKMRGLYVYIRYFAVRNTEGEYLGTLEVTQNIQPIKELQGEKRLLTDD